MVHLVQTSHCLWGDVWGSSNQEEALRQTQDTLLQFSSGLGHLSVLLEKLEDVSRSREVQTSKPGSEEVNGSVV